MPQHERPGFSMSTLTQGQLILGIGSLVLLIALFLPWETVVAFAGVRFGDVEIPGQSVTSSGLSNPIGWLVFLLIIGLFVFEGLVIARVIKGNFNGPLISAAIGGGTALFALILFLTSLGNIAWGAFVGLIATLAVGYGAWVRFQESKRAAPPPAAPPTGSPPAAPPPVR